MQFEKAGAFILNKLSKELPQHLSYQSVEHITDVYDAAQKIGAAEGVSPDEMTLLLTAALFHDSGFIKGAQDHEEESCRIARQNLPDFGYLPEEIEKICGIIMATKIPQSPRNHLEEILADADLDYLGREDFFITGNKLFTELKTQGILRTEQEWNRLQVRFLESHHYFTPTAIKLRKDKKETYLALVKAKIDNIAG